MICFDRVPRWCKCRLVGRVSGRSEGSDGTDEAACSEAESVAGKVAHPTPCFEAVRVGANATGRLASPQMVLGWLALVARTGSAVGCRFGGFPTRFARRRSRP
jgi:hypothetical protein